MFKASHLYTFVISLFFALSICQAQFQPAPVVKSTQKTVYQGKIYYIHTVKQNQTAYSISRAYGVTEQDIAAANPNILLEVIKPGQVLKIPELTNLNELPESYFGLQEEDFFYHKVLPQQTLYYLSKKYNVAEELILKYNPEAREFLQVESIVKIPKPHVISSQKTSSPLNNQPADSGNFYRVKQGDTLYALSQKFGISVAELIQGNPELRWGLKEGTLLYISSTQLPTAFDIENERIFKDTVAKLLTYRKGRCDTIAKFNTTHTTKIALLLPIHALEYKQFDTISNDSIKMLHPYYRLQRRSDAFTEFYQGVLLAIDSLTKAGQNITLFTYDTKSDSLTIKNTIEELKIIKPDFIVGPVLPYNIELVNNFSKEYHIPLVLPVTRHDISLKNKYLIRIVPDRDVEIEESARFLAQYDHDNIIVFHNQDSVGYEYVKKFKQSLLAYISTQNNYENALYKELRYNDTTRHELTHVLRHDLNNIVIILSNNEAYVSELIRQLNLQTDKYKIQLVGLASWQKFRNISKEPLHNLNTTIYAPFYIDYSKEHTQNFVRNSRKTLRFEPHTTTGNSSGYNFTYLGYETTFLITQLHSRYGLSCMNCITQTNFDLPSSNYRFKWVNSGGFVNTQLNFIHYDKDYSVELIPFESPEEKQSIAPEPEGNMHYLYPRRSR